MNHIEQPPEPPRIAGHDAGDIDALLRRYFQRQMPRPWPAFRPPATVPFRLARRKAAAWRSRLTLAASVAALLIGSVAFLGRSHDSAETASVNGPQTASRPRDLHKLPATKADQHDDVVLPATNRHR